MKLTNHLEVKTLQPLLYIDYMPDSKSGFKWSIKSKKITLIF